jgi:hypothetical protein
MAIANGCCSSDPMSEVNKIGIIANIVVRDVIIIAIRRRLPAVWIASISGRPDFRSVLIVSSFKIESFMTIPQVTIMPIADIRLRDWPHMMSANKANAISIGISSRIIRGCIKLSNCAHKIKYISAIDIISTTISSLIIFELEK